MLRYSVAVLIALTTSSAVAAELPGLSCEHVQKHQMIEFGPYLSKVNAAYYKIHFMDDNYPGQLVDGQVVAHPIYATYVLADYVASYNRAKTREGKRAAKASLEAVAKAAVCRMELLPNGGLAFYYREPWVVGNGIPYYSAITQAQYLNVLFQAGKITGLKWLTEAAKRIALSIMLPEDKGGVVFIDKEGRPIPQEDPGTTMRPPQFVLNGWIVVLLALDDYAKASKSKAVRQFTHDALTAVSSEIKKYSAPEIGFTLYKLSDIALVRVLDHRNGGLVLEEGSVSIPEVGTYPIRAVTSSTDAPYGNSFLAPQAKIENGKTILSNGAVGHLWLSLYPTSNKLHLKLRAIEDSELEVQIVSFDPNIVKGQRENVKFTPIYGPMRLKAGESTVMEVTLPRNQIKRAIWPVPYFKPAIIDGKQKYGDVYHATHVSLVCNLAKRMKNAQLAAIANEWDDYTDNWEAISLLKKQGAKYISSSELLGLNLPDEDCRL